MDLIQRPRRLRGSENLRKMVRETRMDKSSLIYPLFVKEGTGIEEEIPSMEGQFRYSVDRLPFELERLQNAGVNSIMLFGIPDHKDEVGSGAYDPNGIVQKALREAKKQFPDMYYITDVCMCEQDADGLQLAIDSMQDCLKDIDVDVIAGTESRGFIFGVPIAYNLHKPFVPIRKKGKLPRETVSVSYDLEYGSAEIEMHKDSIKPGQKVVIVDDLIATGGTIEAAIKLVEQLGGEVVKVVFLMELAGLKGRERLNGYDVASVICYDGK